MGDWEDRKLLSCEKLCENDIQWKLYSMPWLVCQLGGLSIFMPVQCHKLILASPDIYRITSNRHHAINSPEQNKHHLWILAAASICRTHMYTNNFIRNLTSEPRRLAYVRLVLHDTVKGFVKWDQPQDKSSHVCSDVHTRELGIGTRLGQEVMSYLELCHSPHFHDSIIMCTSTSSASFGLIGKGKIPVE